MPRIWETPESMTGTAPKTAPKASRRGRRSAVAGLRPPCRPRGWQRGRRDQCQDHGDEREGRESQAPLAGQRQCDRGRHRPRGEAGARSGQDRGSGQEARDGPARDHAAEHPPGQGRDHGRSAAGTTRRRTGRTPSRPRSARSRWRRCAARGRMAAPVRRGSRPRSGPRPPPGAAMDGMGRALEERQHLLGQHRIAAVAKLGRKELAGR